MHTIRNGVDLTRFTPSGPPDEAVRRQLGGADGQLLALYLGAHGFSQGLSTVAEAAALAGPGVHVAFVGEGADKKQLKLLGTGRHRVQVRLYVPDGQQGQVSGADFIIDLVEVADGWEQLSKTTAMLYEDVVDLPWRVSYDISTRGDV